MKLIALVLSEALFLWMFFAADSLHQLASAGYPAGLDDVRDRMPARAALANLDAPDSYASAHRRSCPAPTTDDGGFHRRRVAPRF